MKRKSKWQAFAYLVIAGLWTYSAYIRFGLAPKPQQENAKQLLEIGWLFPKNWSFEIGSATRVDIVSDRFTPNLPEIMFTVRKEHGLSAEAELNARDCVKPFSKISIGNTDFVFASVDHQSQLGIAILPTGKMVICELNERAALASFNLDDFKPVLDQIKAIKY